jgi:hypothetical protein
MPLSRRLTAVAVAVLVLAGCGQGEEPTIGAPELAPLWAVAPPAELGRVVAATVTATNVVVHADLGVAVFAREDGRLAWQYRGAARSFEPYVTDDAVVVVQPDPAGGQEALIHDLATGALRAGVRTDGTEVRVTQAGVYTVDCRLPRPGCRLRATNVRTGALEWDRLIRQQVWLPLLARPMPTPAQRGLDRDPVAGLAAPADSVVVAAPGPSPAEFDVTLGVSLHRPTGSAHTTGGPLDRYLAAGPVVLRWPFGLDKCVTEVRALDANTGEPRWSVHVGRWRERNCTAMWQPTVADGALYGIGPDRFPFVVDLASGQRWFSGRRATYPVGFTEGVAVTGGGANASLTGYGRDGTRLWRIGEADGFSPGGQFAVAGGRLLRAVRQWHNGEARDVLSIRRADTGRLVAFAAGDNQLFGVGVDALVAGVGLRGRPAVPVPGRDGVPVEIRLFLLGRH